MANYATHFHHTINWLEDFTFSPCHRAPFLRWDLETGLLVHTFQLIKLVRGEPTSTGRALILII